MQIIRTAEGKPLLKMSRIEWEIMGMRAGWKKTVLAQIREKELSGFTVLSQTAGGGDKIKEAVTRSIEISYGSAFLLRRGDEQLEESEAKSIIADAFMFIIGRNRQFGDKIGAYVAKDIPFGLGVYFAKEGDKNYLVPSFNHTGETSLKSEFTGYINARLGVDIEPPPMRKVMDFGESTLKGANEISDVVRLANAAGFIARHGVAEVGSIGSRATNWDTSYGMHVEGAPTQAIMSTLTWFADITNEDVRNVLRGPSKKSYDLTKAQEVNSVMAGLGLGGLFAKTVKEVKMFEERKNLKKIHDRLGRIPDYQTNTLIKRISLSDFRDDIFRKVMQSIGTNPRYAHMAAEAGVTDIQELVNYAFSMGYEGTVMSKDQAVEAVTALAA